MNETISVILNVYKRPYTLEQQIEAIKNQTIKIDLSNIHVWYNKSDVTQFQPKEKEIKTYVCNWNTKFFGRFMIPLLCQSEYIAVFDDDVLPQKDWFKNCLNTIKNYDGILGGSGIITAGQTYNPHIKVGWNGVHSNDVMEVDLVGHAWFFRQKWIKYLWSEPPISWDNGEDIMFSYVCQKKGIKTFVPPHPENNKNLWSNDFNFGYSVGSDINASYRKGTHNNQRDMIVNNLVKRGWKTIKNENI